MTMNSEEKQREGIFDPKHAPMLDADWRVNELQPENLVRDIAGIKTGDTCIDLGSGTGTFAIPMAEAVGRSGRVYAVDNSERMLGMIIAKNPPPQLITIEADVAQIGLGDGIADVCLLAFILHEVQEQDKLIAEAYRLMKPGGRVIILEWRTEADIPMPPKHRRISRDKIEEMFRQVNLALTDYIERTASHYAAIGEKGMNE